MPPPARARTTVLLEEGLCGEWVLSRGGGPRSCPARVARGSISWVHKPRACHLHFDAIRVAPLATWSHGMPRLQLRWLPAPPFLPPSVSTLSAVWFRNKFLDNSKNWAVELAQLLRTLSHCSWVSDKKRTSLLSRRGVWVCTTL